MSAIVEHAKDEFRAAGWMDEEGNFKDAMQAMMCNNILELLEVFSKQGHSGFSAAYLRARLNLLMDFKPLAPLTGEDREWTKVDDDLWQNRRCSTVFKNANGEAWNIDGIVFWEWYKDPETGEMIRNSFTSSDSFVPVTFPHKVPEEPEVRFRPTEEFPNEELEGI